MNVPSKSAVYLLQRSYFWLSFHSSCCMETGIFPPYPLTVSLFAVLTGCTMCSALLVIVLVLIIEAHEMHYLSNFFL